MFLSFTPPFILQHRSGRGLSQTELAKLAGLSRTTVRHAENGGNISISTALRLCTALELDWTAILPTEESHPVDPNDQSHPENLLFDELYNFVSKNGSPEDADTLAYRLERTVNAGTQVMCKMIQLEKRSPLCGRCELSVALVILLARFANLFSHNMSGTELKDDYKYTVLVVDMIAAAAKQVILGHPDRQLFNIVHNALHPTIGKPSSELSKENVADCQQEQ